MGSEKYYSYRGKMSRANRKFSTVYVVIGCIVALIAGAIIIVASRHTPVSSPLGLLAGTSKGASDNSGTNTSPPTRSGRTTLIAVGDIMLSRTVGQKIREHGIGYPFEKTTGILTSGDFAFGNLETSITEGPVVKSGTMMFRADPGVENALKDNELIILSLANNHTPNYGQKGLLDTFDYLTKAGIQYVGAGKNGEEAHTPKIVERAGTRIAFLAYNDSDVVPASYEASSSRAGTALMNINTLKKDIETAKQKADVVFVSMHSGTEYVPGPNARQTAFAHAAIEAGAELVIGHHPHVVQSVEEYQGKLIIYSLGNFVFDQMWSTETQQGVVAEILLAGSTVTNVEFTPIMIEDYAQPRLAQGEEINTILDRLQLDKISQRASGWSPDK
ncbi:MAG: CapA family protein [Patescibacteria group bacterium]